MLSVGNCYYKAANSVRFQGVGDQPYLVGAIMLSNYDGPPPTSTLGGSSPATTSTSSSTRSTATAVSSPPATSTAASSPSSTAMAASSPSSTATAASSPPSAATVRLLYLPPIQADCVMRAIWLPEATNTFGCSVPAPPQPWQAAPARPPPPPMAVALASLTPRCHLNPPPRRSRYHEAVKELMEGHTFVKILSIWWVQITSPLFSRGENVGWWSER